MMRFSFKKGLRFQVADRSWSITRRLLNGSLQLESEDGELLNAFEADILLACSKGEWHVDLPATADPITIEARIPRDLATFPPAVQAIAYRRQEYLNRLISRGELVFNLENLKVLLAEIAAEIGDPAPPSPISIYRWYRRYKNSQSILQLVDRRETQGRRISWSSEVKTIVEEAIETIYLNKQKHPSIAVYNEVQRRLMYLKTSNPEMAATFRIPSRSSIYRYLKNLEKYTVSAARLGRPAAERKFRGVFGMQKTNRLLERWEIDHTPLDLLVYDEESMLPHGRPWLTVALDKYSRMIVGIYVGFGNPSAYSVLQCLRQAILPKQDLLNQFDGITMPWPARGIPETIVTDNGMELHSGSLIKACQELNIQLQFCPAKEPEYKGSVERFFRTISQDLIHRLPGTTFSNIWERGDYASEKTACISFKTLNALLYKWIVEIYHQEKHRGIGMSPAKKWEIGERERIIEYPADPDQLRVITGHAAERTLFHYGIEINSLKYNCPELHTLFRRYGERLKVTLKFYEDDIGYIHVFDPDEKTYIKVPAIDQEYAAGLTLDQHELIRQKLREEARSSTDLHMLLDKKQELQAMIDEAIHHKKMGVRKKVSHIRHMNTVFPGGKSPTGSVVQSLLSRHPLPLNVAASADLPVFPISDNKLYGHNVIGEDKEAS